jgi:hypothetical protein
MKHIKKFNEMNSNDEEHEKYLNLFLGKDNNLEEIKSAVEEGWLDPFYNDGLPLRQIIKGSHKGSKKIYPEGGFPYGGRLRVPMRPGESNLESFKYLFELALYIDKEKAIKLGIELIKTAAEFGRKEIVDYLVSMGCESGKERASDWIRNSRKLREKDRRSMTDYLKK